MSLSPFRSLVLAALLLIAVPACAGDWSLAGGAVRFHAPDSWVTIMQSDNAPALVAFQVPDPSPTGRHTLARVSVKVVKAVGGDALKQMIEDAREHAHTLPGFKRDDTRSGSDTLVYTARENGIVQLYVEHYMLLPGHAVELRCVRPQHSAAGKAWSEHFDHGCQAIAAQLH